MDDDDAGAFAGIAGQVSFERRVALFVFDDAGAAGEREQQECDDVFHC